VIAAGRNEAVLSTLRDLGADATVKLDRSDQELTEAFARELGGGLHVIIDYLWGRPTEALLAAITRREFAAITSEMRLVQVGESAGPVISLPAAVPRSAALTILGTAGIPPREVLESALHNVMALAARGEFHIDTEQVPLADIEDAWKREVRGGRRLVVIP
jgi:D-arabinose 1-dehydrogenase-like Zn-dependent alcohol dehydrogenase